MRPRRKYFLDRKGARPGVRSGKKLTWIDKYENSHDLDFVIERGGDVRRQGRPVAFIEAAWRRYTKHSRNKAQEIQGAILPIREHHHRDAPFLGAVLAGNFTKPALEQLRRQGFQVVHLSYDAIMRGLQTVGIEARFRENTPDDDFKRCVRDITALNRRQRETLRQGIVEACGDAFSVFFGTLGRTLDRQVDRIMILPLHGEPLDFTSSTDAEAYLDDFKPSAASLPFRRFDITILFSNDDKVQMSVTDAADAKDFLSYVLS